MDQRAEAIFQVPQLSLLFKNEHSGTKCLCGQVQPKPS